MRQLHKFEVRPQIWGLDLHVYMKKVVDDGILISKFYKNEYGDYICWKRDTEQCSNKIIYQNKRWK